MPRNLADKMRSDASNVFLRLDHFAEQVDYVSVSEGTKAGITALKTEVEGGGDKHQQNAQKRIRRARFQVRDTVEEGVGSPVESRDKINTTENDQTITWTVMKVITREAGLWCLECETYILTSQGQNKPNGI